MAIAAKKKPAAPAAPNNELNQIPLNKLVASPLNVRKTPAGSLEELAASIHAEGLLQNLTVLPQVNSRGKPSGTYEVVGGERRRQALTLLVERGHLPASCPIPCKLVSAEQAISASVAENSRVPLHPADQFEAFQRMLEDGQSPQQIAERFGISTLVVERRLKLAKVAPKLLDLYRKDGIKLEELMALALTDNSTLQLQVWELVKDRYPAGRVAAIRHQLTADEIDSADDPRALFVGIDAYQAMGGTVRRDLFSDDTHFYLDDAGLLERLAQGKLEGIANELKAAEGLAWVEVMPELDSYTLRNAFSKAATEPATLTKRQAARLKQVERELERLCKQHDGLIDDEKDEEADALTPRIEALEDEQRELEQQMLQPTALQRENGVGAVVTIGPGGRASIFRHLVKVEDKKAAAAPASTALSRFRDEEEGDDKREPEAAPAKLSEALVKRLTAHRTAALQVTLASQPRIALIALTHKLVLENFYDEHFGGMVGLRGDRPNLRQAADDIGDTKAVTSLFELKDFLAGKLPNLEETDDRAGALFDWMLQAPQELIEQLLAFCTALYVDTIAGSSHQRPQALRLMPVLGLDLADWWAPTRENYFNHVPKPLIDAAVIDGAGQVAAMELKGLKKAAAAELAEKKLAGLRWLPEVLRGGE